MTEDKEKKELNIEDLKKRGEENKFSSSSESRLRDEGGKEREALFNPIDISRELEECQKLKDEYLQGWQRARADFLNYKKEEIERIGEFLKYSAEEFVLKILPVLDNFDVAVKKLPENLKVEEGLPSSSFAEARESDENPEGEPSVPYGASIKGFLQIKRQLENFLKNQGVEEIKSIGEKFDPNLHETVGEVEIKDKESGIIIEEIQKGYKINGRLLRPAKVKVVK